MSEKYPEYSAVGGDLVAFELTPELRWKINPTPGDRPTLQQKWVASKSYGGVTYADEQWRDVPSFEEK